MENEENIKEADFEPWVKGAGPRLTPAFLHEVAKDHFWAVFFASELLYKSKDELRRMIDEDQDAMMLICDHAFAAKNWFSELQDVVNAVTARCLVAVGGLEDAA